MNKFATPVIASLLIPCLVSATSVPMDLPQVPPMVRSFSKTTSLPFEIQALDVKAVPFLQRAFNRHLFSLKWFPNFPLIYKFLAHERGEMVIPPDPSLSPTRTAEPVRQAIQQAPKILADILIQSYKADNDRIKFHPLFRTLLTSPNKDTHLTLLGSWLADHFKLEMKVVDTNVENKHSDIMFEGELKQVFELSADNKPKEFTDNFLTIFEDLAKAKIVNAPTGMASFIFTGLPGLASLAVRLLTGHPLSLPLALGLVATSAVGFALHHWSGVWRAMSSEEPAQANDLLVGNTRYRFTPFKSRERWPTWRHLFRLGIQFHGPFYLALLLTSFYNVLPLITALLLLYCTWMAEYKHSTHNRKTAPINKDILAMAEHPKSERWQINQTASINTARAELGHRLLDRVGFGFEKEVYGSQHWVVKRWHLYTYAAAWGYAGHRRAIRFTRATLAIVLHFIPESLWRNWEGAAAWRWHHPIALEGQKLAQRVLADSGLIPERHTFPTLLVILRSWPFVMFVKEAEERVDQSLQEKIRSLLQEDNWYEIESWSERLMDFQRKLWNFGVFNVDLKPSNHGLIGNHLVEIDHDDLTQDAQEALRRLWPQAKYLFEEFGELLASRPDLAKRINGRLENFLNDYNAHLVQLINPLAAAPTASETGRHNHRAA